MSETFYAPEWIHPHHSVVRHRPDTDILARRRLLPQHNLCPYVHRVGRGQGPPPAPRVPEQDQMAEVDRGGAQPGGIERHIQSRRLRMAK